MGVEKEDAAIGSQASPVPAEIFVLHPKQPEHHRRVSLMPADWRLTASIVLVCLSIIAGFLIFDR